MSTRKGPGAANYLMSMAGTATPRDTSQAQTLNPDTEDRTGERDTSAHAPAIALEPDVATKRRATAADAPVLRMALALTPENATYLEVVRMMRRTNKTALVNQAIEAMRAADTEYEAMRAAYDAFSSFRV